MTARQHVQGGAGEAPTPGDAEPDDREQQATDVEATAAQPAEAGAASDERYLRLAADFENYRRRAARELAERTRYASEDAARALLPVLDNLRRAVDHAAESAPDIVAGLELVVREFEAALDRLGVTPIDAEGRPFDPAVHEAIGGEETEGVDVDTVASEVQRGYRIHDRVLRPSLVRVAHPVTPER